MLRDERDRGRADPTYLGAIRGGFGNPSKRVRTDIPVREVTTRIVSEALTARGLLVPQGVEPSHDLEVAITELRCSQVV